MPNNMFVRDQLDYLSNLIAEDDYPNMLIASGQLIPIVSEGGKGSDTISYRIFTKVGEAAVVGNGGEDIPTVTGYMEKRYAEIYSIKNQYVITYEDLERAAFAQENVEGYLATSAREMIDRKIDLIGYEGEANSRLLGILNHPNVPTYVLPGDGNLNGGVNSTQFKHKSAEQIFRDLVNFVTGVALNTKGVEIPRTLLLPREAYDIIANTPFTLGGNTISKTILEAFLDGQSRSGGISNIVPVDYLTGSGVGGTNVMVCYTPAENKLRYHIPERLLQMPTEYRAMKYHNILRARVAGVVVIKPISMRYANGV